MKKIIILIVCWPLISFTAPEDDTFSFNSTDKQLHMLASYGLMYTLTDIYRRAGHSKWKSLLWGSLSTLAVGTLKEVTDPKFSSNDLAADSIGIVVGAGVILTFDSIWEPQISSSGK